MTSVVWLLIILGIPGFASTDVRIEKLRMTNMEACKKAATTIKGNKDRPVGAVCVDGESGDVWYAP